MAASEGPTRRAPPRAGLRPFGLGETKPHHFLEILRTAWENKRHPLFAYRVLRDGVCDGCALGTTGMRDFTMKGVHLCTVRLNLLKLNTADALDIRYLEDVSGLREISSRDLRDRRAGLRTRVDVRLAHVAPRMMSTGCTREALRAGK